MQLQEIFTELKRNKSFIEWHHGNKHCYLSYVMKMIEKQENNEWHFGFYDKPKDKVTTFVLSGKKIILEPEDDVAKHEHETVPELVLDKVKLDLVEAAKIAQEFQIKKFPNDKPMKIISVLQNLSKFGTIWNFTFVTLNFNTLNIKVNAETGEIVENTLQQIFEMRR